MDMLSFAAGLAIGKKKYGGGGSENALYHKILNESLPLGGITINSTYRYTFNAFLDDGNLTPSGNRDWLYESGHNFMFDLGSGPPTAYSFYSTQYVTLDLYAIAYENNNPIFAVQSQRQQTEGIEINFATQYVNGVNKIIYYPSYSYTMDSTGYSLFGSFEPTFSGTSASDKFLLKCYSETGASVRIIKKDYKVKDRSSEEDFPELEIYNTTTETVSFSSAVNLFAPFSSDRVYSDNSNDWVLQKYNNILTAVYDQRILEKIPGYSIPNRAAIILQPPE